MNKIQQIFSGSPLEQIKTKTAKALGLFTKTLNELNQVLDTIEIEENQTQMEIEQAEAYLSQLADEKASTSNIASKIRMIIE